MTVLADVVVSDGWEMNLGLWPISCDCHMIPGVQYQVQVVLLPESKSGPTDTVLEDLVCLISGTENGLGPPGTIPGSRASTCKDLEYLWCKSDLLLLFAMVPGACREMHAFIWYLLELENLLHPPAADWQNKNNNPCRDHV